VKNVDDHNDIVDLSNNKTASFNVSTNIKQNLQIMNSAGQLEEGQLLQSNITSAQHSVHAIDKLKQ